MPKKIIGWVVVGFVLFYVARNPTAAAVTVKELGTGLATGAQGFSEFFTTLALGVD